MLNKIKNYETILIFTPVLSDKIVQNVYLEYENFLIENKAEIINKEIWGMKKLAYKIKKNKNGFFFILQYKIFPNFLEIIKNKILQDERIIRFLIIKINKNALEYSLKNKKKNEKENK
ncbi:MAG: 30S ribosomal protein S6 [Candidatus Shikimatogenerans sp. JK-2022]|nr:30S ribosomal protein S6 [Candidatus Shikimatogenerans bostrichidophilus]